MSGEFVEAIENDDYKTVLFFLKELKWNPNSRQYFSIGRSVPMKVCCIKNRPRCLQALLDCGATPFIVDGEIPLPHVAALYNSAECLRILLDKTVMDLNELSNGDTALITAVVNGHNQVVKILLGHENVDVNIQGSSDRTALHFAVLRDDQHIVKMLLESPKIDITIADKDGKVAADLCKSKSVSDFFKNRFVIEKKIQLEKSKTEIDAKKEDLKKITKKVKLAEERLAESKREIDNAENEAALIESQMKKLKTKLNVTHWTECPICNEVMVTPRKILLCPNSHWFCDVCRAQMNQCPSCRTNIANVSLQRNIALEQLINEQNE